LPNAEKVEKVARLKERIEGSSALLLADFRGLSVTDVSELRRSLDETDTRFSIVKNTLMKLAAEESGLGNVSDLLEGPTAVGFVGGDAVAAAKRLVDAAKRYPALELKGAYVEGRLLSASDAQTLATLDSREAMLSKVAGMAKAEMARAAAIFQTLQGRFLGLLEAYREKLPAAEEPATPSQDAESQPADAATEPAEAAAPEADVEAEATDTSTQSETETPAEPEAPAAAEPEADAPAAPEARTDTTDANEHDPGSPDREE
jgi:large subunit ribosomal protein L10